MRAKKDTVIFLLFFLLGVASRWLFASKDFTHMDGVLYAIGTFNFSVADGTPPSPGYYLYIMSAKFLNAIFHDPHNSLMAISIIYSGLIAGTLYYFGSLLKSRMAGIVSVVLFLTSPLFWYKGITVFGYLNSGFFVLLTALLGYKVILEGEKRIILWFSVTFAVLLGIRPQEFLVMLPLFVFVLFHMKPKEALSSVIVFVIACGLWLIPLIFMSGGLATYLSAVKGGSIYIVEDSILGSNFIGQLNNHLVRMGRYFEWAYFLGAVPLIYYAGRFFYLPNLANDKKLQFFSVWIAPAVLYNIFIQFGEIGHGMSWGLGLLLLLGESVVVLSDDILKLFRVNYPKGLVCSFILCPIILVNLFMFFHDFNRDGADFYDYSKYRQFNYMDVVKNNDFFLSKVDFIKNNFKPADLLIISSGAFGHQVMFRLPEAIVIQPNVIYKKGRYGLFLFKDHKRSYYHNKTDFVVPEGVTKLVLFDDIFIPYFHGRREARCYEAGGSYRLLVCDVSAGQKIVLDYHSIRLE